MDKTFFSLKKNIETWCIYATKNTEEIVKTKKFRKNLDLKGTVVNQPWSSLYRCFHIKL